jgi:hypothetical protein
MYVRARETFVVGIYLQKAKKKNRKRKERKKEIILK